MRAEEFALFKLQGGSLSNFRWTHLETFSASWFSDVQWLPVLETAGTVQCYKSLLKLG